MQLRYLYPIFGECRADTFPHRVEPQRFPPPELRLSYSPAVELHSTILLALVPDDVVGL
jgi:hypothetical protein